MKIGSVMKEMIEVVDRGHKLMEELEGTNRSTNGNGHAVGYRNGYGNDVKLKRIMYRGVGYKGAGTPTDRSTDDRLQKVGYK